MAYTRSLKRSLSKSNVATTAKLHDHIKERQLFLREASSSVVFPKQYDAPALNLCIDTPLLKELEDEGVINWCNSCRFLMPLEVEEDGSSLVHSLSLYMFGVHDRRNVLRRLLHERLTNETEGGKLRTRWKTALLENPAATEICWEQIVDMASDKILDDNYKIQRYANLEGIHVFALANILGRPIIIISNSSPGSDDSSCGGIYLPLLRPSKMCEKSPVIIGYKNAHFAPLISSENLRVPFCKCAPSEEAKHCVPLMNNKSFHFQLKFLSQSERTTSVIAELLREYLEIIRIQCDVDGQDSTIDAAMLRFKVPPNYSIELMWCLKAVAEKSPSKNNTIPPPEGEPIYDELIPCSRKILGCNNFAAFNSERLCTPCFEIGIEKNTLPKRSSFANSKVESANTNVLRTKMENFYGDINSFYEYNKRVENKLHCINSQQEPLNGDNHAINHSNVIANDEEYCYVLHNDPYTPSGRKNKCNVLGCTGLSLVGQSYCSVHSNHQQCATKDCTNNAGVNDCGLCLVCFQKSREWESRTENELPNNIQGLPQTNPYEINENLYLLPVDGGHRGSNLNDAYYHGQVKRMEKENLTLKAKQRHSDPNPSFQRELMQRINMGNKASTIKTLEPSPITAGLPHVPKPPSPNHQEQVNSQLSYHSVGCPRVSSASPNLDNLIDRHNFIPSKDQGLLQTIADEENNENIYVSPDDKGNRGLNQKQSYHGDQDGSPNMQKGRKGSLGTNKNKCLFCDNHGNPDHGGYCNECNLYKKSQQMNQINSTTNEPLLLDGQQHEPTYLDKQQYELLLAEKQGKQGKCKGNGCEFFGTIEFGGYCSGCFVNLTKQEL